MASPHREGQEYLDVPPHQRLGLRKAVRGLEQTGEVVEADRDKGMIRPIARLGNRERAPPQRLDLRDAARSHEQLGEVVEPDRDIGMIRPVARLVDRERAPPLHVPVALRFRIQSTAPFVPNIVRA